MMTSSNGQSFDVFFDLCLNKRLSKQTICRWFETRSLYRHCNDGRNPRNNIDKNDILLAHIVTNFSQEICIIQEIWIVSVYEIVYLYIYTYSCLIVKKDMLPLSATFNGEAWYYVTRPIRHINEASFSVICWIIDPRLSQHCNSEVVIILMSTQTVFVTINPSYVTC